MSFKRFYINVFIIIFTFFLCVPHVSAASSSVYNYEVLNDLLKDESFDDSKYPSEINNYSLSVISIGESDDDNLYIYVYQPSHEKIDLIATKISLSVGYSLGQDNLKPKVYYLELVSSFSVFDKYKVKDFVIPDSDERYYNIVSILRKYNDSIDKTESSSTSEIAYNVGQQWCCYYEDEKLIYEMQTFETLEITPTLTASVRFQGGYSWGTLVGIVEKCDAHFIAFNCDNYKVDHIYDADLTYKLRDVTESVSLLGTNYTYGEYGDDQYVTLKDTDQVSYEGKGLFAKEYTWNRIMTAENFVTNFEDQDGDLNVEAKEILDNSQWVFAFLETEYTMSVAGATNHYYSKEPSEVLILRIYFSNDHGTYDLGVVSDSTNSSGNVGSVDVDIDDILGIDNDTKDLIKKILQILGLFILGWIIIQVIKILIPKENYSRKRNKK